MGTEGGLYSFTFNEAIGIGGSIGAVVPGPNGATGYKVTSMSKVKEKTAVTDKYFMTIYGTNAPGLYLYDPSITNPINRWTQLSGSFNARRNLNSVFIHSFNTTDINSPTRLLEVENSSGVVTGFLLFNEEDNTNYSGNNYATGVFYKKVDASNPDYIVPTGSSVAWEGLFVNYNAGEPLASDFGWILGQPSADPTSVTIVDHDKIIDGRTGFLFATTAPQDLPGSTNITKWQQIYTTKTTSPSSCHEFLYQHKGFVNTSSRAIFPDPTLPGRLWMGQYDRWLWTSDNLNGTGYSQIKQPYPFCVLSPEILE